MVYENILICRGILIEPKICLELISLLQEEDETFDLNRITENIDKNCENCKSKETNDKGCSECIDLWEIADQFRQATMLFQNDSFNVRYIKPSPPCCADNKKLFIGDRLYKIKRQKYFTWDLVKPENVDFVKEIIEERFKNRKMSFQFCGEILELDQTNEIELKDRCGYLMVCNRCIGYTIGSSGSSKFYDVNKMAEEIIECKTYCKSCDRDDCNFIKKDLDFYLQFKSFFGEHVVKKIINYRYQIDKCKHLSQGYEGYQGYETCTQLIENFELEDFIDEHNIKMKNYYILDDCLSCT